MSKIEHYEVKDGTLIRKTKTCPKCGDGVFMAEHSNRTSCGKCGYTEFKKMEKPTKEKAKKEGPSAPDTGAPSLLEE